MEQMLRKHVWAKFLNTDAVKNEIVASFQCQVPRTVKLLTLHITANNKMPKSKQSSLDCSL